MTTYNGENYIQQQLDSILRQTYLPDELIICDDNSTDNTINIVNEFLKISPFLAKIFCNKKNIGYVLNFQKAISLCTGDVILLSDHDDIWCPDRIERTYIAFENNPNCGYLFSDAHLINNLGEDIKDRLWRRVGFTLARQSDFADPDKQPHILFPQNCVTGATLAFRAKHREYILPFPLLENLIHDGWISLILSLCGFYGIALQRPLIYYRIHKDQQLGVPKYNFLSKIKSLFKKRKSYIKSELFTLNYIESNIKKYEDKFINDRFYKNFSLQKNHLIIRCKIISTKSRIKRLFLIISYYRYDGYNIERRPFFSALKDFIYY